VTTTTTHDQLEAIQAQLEERYEFHTDQLRQLMEGGDEDPGSASLNAALWSRSRQSLSEIARALRYMAEGRYGRCLGCQDEIPIERLQARPEALLCAACQETQDRQNTRHATAA
jgi:DnaK suppressor protein